MFKIARNEKVGRQNEKGGRRRKQEHRLGGATIIYFPNDQSVSTTPSQYCSNIIIIAIAHHTK